MEYVVSILHASFCDEECLVWPQNRAVACSSSHWRVTWAMASCAYDSREVTDAIIPDAGGKATRWPASRGQSVGSRNACPPGGVLNVNMEAAARPQRRGADLCDTYRGRGALAVPTRRYFGPGTMSPFSIPRLTGQQSRLFRWLQRAPTRVLPPAKGCESVLALLGTSLAPHLVTGALLDALESPCWSPLVHGPFTQHRPSLIPSI